MLIIFAVAVLGIRQIDSVPPSQAELYSLYNAGILLEQTFSPAELVDWLYGNTADHMPGYFILLSAWSNLISGDLAVARLLSIYAGLLSLAVAYRLGRDFITPSAGIIVVILVASNTNYNFYYSYGRMYSLVVLAAGCVLWSYLHMVYRVPRLRFRHFAVFALSCVALLSLHALNALALLAAMSCYHLLNLRKSLRWSAMPLATGLAIACMAPFLLKVYGDGATRFGSIHTEATLQISGAEFTAAYLNTLLNNQPVILLFPLFGLVWGIKRKALLQTVPWFLIGLFGFAILTIAFEVYGSFYLKHMRYGLSVFLPFMALVAAGITPRPKIWRLVAVGTYVMAAVTFQASGDWKPYLGGSKGISHETPPLQVISRFAMRVNPKPHVLLLGDSEYLGTFTRPIYGGLSAQDYYFAQHGISFAGFVSEPAIPDPIVTPSVWIVHHPDIAAADLDAVHESMRSRQYQLCVRQRLGSNGVLLRYIWAVLDCDFPLNPIVSDHNAITAYQYFGNRLDHSEAKLYFVNRWDSRAGESVEQFSVSYQVVSAESINMAQLDMPLSHITHEVRQFWIDISNLNPGAYRMVVIVYNSITGERLSWLDSATQARALQLAAFAI